MRWEVGNWRLKGDGSAIEIVPAEDERDKGRNDDHNGVDDEGETDAPRELDGPGLAYEGEGKRGDGAGDQEEEKYSHAGIVA